MKKAFQKLLPLAASMAALIFFLTSCGGGAAAETKPKPKPAVKIPKNRKADPAIFPILSDVYAAGANLDIDAKIYVWHGCQLATISRDGAEGKEHMKITIDKGGDWFGWGVHVYPDGEASDMRAFTNGVLELYLKATNGAAPFKIGVKSGYATESWVSMADPAYGFTADNTWRKVTVPLNKFKPEIKFNAVSIYFMFSQVGTPKPGTIYFLDGVLWKL